MPYPNTIIPLLRHEDQFISFVEPLRKTGRSATVKLRYVKAPKWTSEHMTVDPKERNALTGPQWVRAPEERCSYG